VLGIETIWMKQKFACSNMPNSSTADQGLPDAAKLPCSGKQPDMGRIMYRKNTAPNKIVNNYAKMNYYTFSKKIS
jgi:hypothetical protein